MKTHRLHKRSTVRIAARAALLVLLVAGAAALVAAAPASAAPSVITFAGTPGVPGSTNATGTAARFSYARGVAVDGSGNVYVADTNNSTIRMITPAGVVTTLAGSPGLNGSADGTGSAARFNYPEGLAWDAFTGTLLVADTQNNMIREVTTGGVVTTIAGQLGVGGFGGYVDGLVGVAMFKHPRGVTAAAAGTIFVGDSGNDALRVIDATRTNVGTRAGGTGVFANPRGVAVDSGGNVYVADFNNHRIAKVTSGGAVSTLAGSDTGLFGSTDGTGTAARFYNPDGLARNATTGDLYVGDSANNTIRKVTTGGVVTTVTGSPPPTAAGSTDGTLAAARFNDPRGIAVDSGGNLYIADRANSTIRKTVAAAFFITASAGANGSITPSGVVGVASGSTVTFTITPAANSGVLDVLVDGVSVGSVSSYTFTSVAANHTIAASFAINSFVITPSAGANGSITPGLATPVLANGSQSFTITPTPGYHVATVLVDSVSVGAVTSYTFTNVTANHTISATFALGPPVTVVSPNGGESWIQTTIHPITWTIDVAVPAGGYFLVRLNNGSGWTTLGTVPTVALQTSYSFNWTVTQPARTDNKIYVQYVDSRGYFLTRDASNAPFTIAAPGVTVTSPNGGESWAQATIHPITWTLNLAVPAGGYFIVQLNNGSGWTTLGTVPTVALQTIYSFNWTVTQPPRTDNKIYVQYVDSHGYYLARDASNSVFTITP